MNEINIKKLRTLKIQSLKQLINELELTDDN